MVRRDPRHKVLANQNATCGFTWIGGPTRASKRPKTKASHLKMTHGPGGLANGPWARTPLRFDVTAPHWSYKSIQGGIAAANHRQTAPSYKH